MMSRYEYSWEEETLIIDLYTRTATRDVRDDNPEIRKLYEYLSSKGYDCVLSGVRRKMDNLKSVDEKYTCDGKQGLKHIRKEFGERWCAYQDNGFMTLDHDVEKAYNLIEHHIASPTPIIPRVQRDGQSMFRERVLAAYEGTCCITGMKERSLLQACHIKAYSACKNEGQMDQAADVRNGLCMNALCHRAFDAGLIAIDEDMCLMFSPTFVLDKDDKFFRPFEGKKIYQSPRAVAGENYLDYHRKHVFVES